MSVELLHLGITGAGRDVVVLHGSPQDPIALAAFVQAALPGARVLSPHMPGYQGSGAIAPDPQDPLGLAALERTLAPALAEAPIVVGMSGGAYRALALAVRGKLKLAGLVLLGAFAEVEPVMAATLSGGADAVQAGIDMREAMIPGWFTPDYAKDHHDEAFAIVSREVASAKSLPAVAAELRAFAAAPSLLAALPEVALRIHAIVGERDLATPLKASEQVVAAVPHAELHVLPGLPHFAHVEDPATVTRRLASLVGDLS